MQDNGEKRSKTVESNDYSYLNKDREHLPLSNNPSGHFLSSFATLRLLVVIKTPEFLIRE